MDPSADSIQVKRKVAYGLEAYGLPLNLAYLLQKKIDV